RLGEPLPRWLRQPAARAAFALKNWGTAGFLRAPTVSDERAAHGRAARSLLCIESLIVKSQGFWVWALCLCALLAVGCKKKADSAAGGASTDAPARLRIAVIPKGTTHEFWKA